MNETKTDSVVVSTAQQTPAHNYLDFARPTGDIIKDGAIWLAVVVALYLIARAVWPRISRN